MEYLLALIPLTVVAAYKIYDHSRRLKFLKTYKFCNKKNCVCVNLIKNVSTSNLKKVALQLKIDSDCKKGILTYTKISLSKISEQINH